MDLSFTPEQELLADQVRRFLADRYGFEARRAIVRSREGWSREVWAGLAEMGLLGLQAPEAHGGMGPAPVETLIAMTAFGRALLVEPYLSSAVVATALLRDLGSAAQQAEWLPALAAGELLAAPAHGEPGMRHDLALVSAAASRRGDGWSLTGHKAAVLHAPAAGLLLVSARSGGRPGEEAGISLFAVPAGERGLSLVPYRTFDGHLAAEVRLEGATGQLVGPEGGAFPALEASFDLGVAALCAEAVGAMQASLDATLDHVKTRKQFGVPIGKFQVLQHRLVDMLMHLEQARSMSYLAAVRAGSADARERRRSVSAAKVVVGKACRFVGQESVQLHGGMGVTDELPVSHHFRRLTAIELSLGDTEHHLERFVGNAQAPPRPRGGREESA